MSELGLSEDTQLMLEELEQLDGVPVETILARAVKAYWGRRLLEASNAAYDTLRTDPQAWQELEHERAAWDVTLADGLADT